MEIIRKLANKQKDLYSFRPATIAFLGDSVTQGCFEIYPTSDSSLETIYDQEYAYHNYLKKQLASVFPASPVVIVNAGISGDNATNALQRLDRDVLSFKPDLVVVCFGLNDCAGCESGLKAYKSSLKRIVSEVKATGAEVILMTPNAMCDHVSIHVKNDNYPFITKCVEGIVEVEKAGFLEAYVNAMREVAVEENVPLCDVYARWKKLKEYGTDVTELLANKANHPIRELNAVFAQMLFMTMIDN